MFKSTLKRAMRKFGERYNYDVGYIEHFIDVDAGAFFKFSKIQAAGNHRNGIPAEPWYAAKIRTVLSEDCGPCTQLCIDMALEAGVSPAHIDAIVRRDFAHLPDETELVIRFTELTLAHDPGADALRDEIIALWGEVAVVSLALAISLSRVYPTLKYALGHGKACTRLAVEDRTVSPVRAMLLGASA